MAAALERVRRRHLPFLCFENLQVIISSLVWWCKQRISIFHSCNWEQEVARERQSKDVIIEGGGGDWPGGNAKSGSQRHGFCVPNGEHIRLGVGERPIGQIIVQPDCLIMGASWGSPSSF